MIDLENDGIDDIIESYQDSEVSLPSSTKWDPVCSFCGFDLNYVKSIKAYFLNSWEVSLCFPIVVSFIIISSYFVFLFCHLKYNPKIGMFSFLFMTIFMFFFICSYYKTFLEGPGYLPFHYPYKLESQHIGKKDYISGIVTSPEQLIYIENLPVIPRAKYFKSARRIVIRPDHYCMWVASFVGKRNHKFFFLFNFWGVVYISLFMVSSISTLMLMLKDSNMVSMLLITITYLVFGLFFLMMTSMFVFEMLCDITSNKTQFEKMRKKRSFSPQHYSKSCVENWEDVFGSVERWWTWFLPVNQFEYSDDFMLLSSRNTDKML